MSRTDTLIRSLKEAIDFHGHLYTEEEIRFMKNQLRSLKESRQEFLTEKKNGFGS